MSAIKSRNDEVSSCDGGRIGIPPCVHRCEALHLKGVGFSLGGEQ